LQKKQQDHAYWYAIQTQNIQKKTLLPICLGIFLAGILIPNAFGYHGTPSSSGAYWSALGSDWEHALFNELTPGVKFPAPNFMSAVSAEMRLGDARGFILELYFESTSPDGSTYSEYFSDGYFQQKDYGYEFGIYDAEDRKIVNALNKDLLVFEIIAENKSDNPLILSFGMEFMEKGFYMYDGKDRAFTPVTNESHTGVGGKTEDPSFTWSEICPLYNYDFKIQPGINEKFKLCFEVPKDSDHFKIVYRDEDKSNQFMVVMFDRERMEQSVKVQSQPDLNYPESTSPSAESSYVIITLLVIAVVIGGIIVAILVAKKGSKPPTTVARTTWKQTTVLFCDSCGTQYRTDAKFCGKCGAPRS